METASANNANSTVRTRYGPARPGPKKNVNDNIGWVNDFGLAGSRTELFDYVNPALIPERKTGPIGLTVAGATEFGNGYRFILA